MKDKSIEIPKTTLLWMYEKMLTIRLFETQANREADAGKLLGMHSSIGQEAVPTGICSQLQSNDYVLGTHRSHHHCIAKGVELKSMKAELLGKATGTNKGKGGTMHIADINKGMLGANGVVGSNIPVATGVALTAKVKGTNQVSVVFFGDGASSQGVLHESMNLASIWKLPVIFVCENNRYAESTPFEYSVAGGSVSSRADGYGMPGVTVDGQSVLDIYEVGKGPQQLLIESNNLWVSRTFYSEDFTETYFGTSLINMKTDDIKIMNYGTGTVCGGDLMNFDGIVHRTFDGGVAPLNADLNVNKLGKIGSFNKEELYSANAFEDKVYMGITSDYMSPDTVFVHDETGEVINTFTVGAAPGDFAIWKE